MSTLARVTDSVEHYQQRFELPRAVRVIRARAPERFRWRTAVSNLTGSASGLLGRERMRVEEPIREVVLDLSDRPLQREVVLDARRRGVDLDRGEVLPVHTGLDLRRLVYLVGTDLSLIDRHIRLPADVEAPIDTAAVALVGRALATAHRRRAQRFWLEIPDPDGPDGARPEHRVIAERAEEDTKNAERWAALSKALLEG